MNPWIFEIPSPMIGLVQDGQLPTAVPSMDGGTPLATPASPGSGTGTPAAAPGGSSAAPVGFGGPMTLFIFGMLAFMIIMTMMSSRKEKKRTAAMLSSIKRGDKVQMLGGMIGKIDQVKDDAVVVRVDEVSGTKIHFAKSAVQRVLESSS